MCSLYFIKSMLQAVSCLMHFNGKYWIRLSANIYNSKEDYITLKDALLKFIENKKSNTAAAAAISNKEIPMSNGK